MSPPRSPRRWRLGHHRRRHGRRSLDHDRDRRPRGGDHDVLGRTGQQLRRSASDGQGAGPELPAADWSPTASARTCYVYFAMGFSVFVEMINLRLAKKGKAVKLHDAYKPVED